MDDGAAVGRPVHQGEVLLDAVQGLHLESPPVSPEGAADAALGQGVGQLVGFDAVVEGGDAEAELVGQVDHLRHLVGAVAVDVHGDVAAQDLGQRVQAQVARRRLAVVAGLAAAAAVLLGLQVAVPGLAVFLCLGEGGAIAGEVAHPGHRRLAAAAVDALGVFAAGHLQAVRRVRELHRLHGGGGDVLEHHAAAADQVGRTRQHHHAGDAAGQGGTEARVLRPDAVLGPDLGGHRRGHLVAVVVGADARRRVHAQVRVHVDQAGRQPLAAAVHDGGAAGLQVAADRGDAAVAHQHVGVFQTLAVAGQHGGAAYQHRAGRHGLVGAGIGRHQGPGLCGRRQQGRRRQGEGQQADLQAWIHVALPRSPATLATSGAGCQGRSVMVRVGRATMPAQCGKEL